MNFLQDDCKPTAAATRNPLKNGADLRDRTPDPLITKPVASLKIKGFPVNRAPSAPQETVTFRSSVNHRSSLTAIALDESAAAIERLQAELAEAVLAEREACAKVAEGHRYGDSFLDACQTRREHREHIASAIRERT